MKEDLKVQSKDIRNVIFLDSQANIWKYYSALDLLILPSLYEGIPLVSIEAQANGLPIIASLGVSNEIEINDNVERIGLDRRDIWIEEIEKKPERIVSNLKLKKSGWDIKYVTKILNELYLKLYDS